MKLAGKIFAAICVMAAIVAYTVNAEAALFELNSLETVTKGVTYEKSRQVTENGLLDVHVLRIILTDPNIKIAPAESANEYGLKETVLNMLTAGGAVAGVNGDFFGLTGRYSASFGPVFKDGELISVSAGFNREANEYASFLINIENNPFIMYLKTDIEFINNNEKTLNIHSINKITDMVMPIIVNRQAMDDTSSLDARFPGLLKVVVENGLIKNVSQKGETVSIPQNGYVIVMNQDMADYHGQFYKVGQTAKLNMKSGMDFSRIETAIGGGGRLLLDGETVNDTGMVIKGRQPRTALGITQDKSQMILMVVDGRTHSIGAGHDEMADLMKRFGAYNAMHLDGGGSSTMAVQKQGDSELEVVNTVSDGSMRKVMNALGVYNIAPLGRMSQIVIEAESDKIFVNTPAKIDIYGLDDYYHRIELPQSEVIHNNNDHMGYWKDGYYYPGRTGEINFIAAGYNIASERSFSSMNLMELKTTQDVIKTVEEERIPLYFTGVGDDGEEGEISGGITYEIVPSSLGRMEGNMFVAVNPGRGYIKCSVNDIYTFIELSVGGRNVILNDFENITGVEYTVYPDFVVGGLEYTSEHKVSGNMSARMTYTFSPHDGTEAAYVNFNPPLAISGQPVGLKLSAYGNNTGDWLRGRIIDATGREFPIDFATEIDWEGWKTLRSAIPADAKLPIKLDRIYVARLTNVEISSNMLYLDSLAAVYPLDDTPVSIPEAPKFKDPLNVKIDETPLGGSIDIAFLGNIGSPDKQPAYDELLKKLLDKYDTFAFTSFGMYTGDVEVPAKAYTHKWNSDYIMYGQGNVGIIQMSSEKGGFFSTNPEQWSRFYNDIKNSGKDHIIIAMDKNPANFAQKKEFELFHDSLRSIRENSGINIFVVSTDGSKSSAEINDGIRYINIGSLVNEGVFNEGYRILRLRVLENDIKYELQKIEG